MSDLVIEPGNIFGVFELCSGTHFFLNEEVNSYKRERTYQECIKEWAENASCKPILAVKIKTVK